MDTAHQWPQEIFVKPIEEIVTDHTCPKPASALERKARPQKEQALNCPRCNSTNTKFCYYNNYSLTQPRYFCKTCRRYWTEGGSLRNIPVGGGSRKNKRSSSSSKKLPDLVTPPSLSSSHQNPNKIHDHHHGQDLNLAFPAAATSTQGFRSISEFFQVPNIGSNNKNQIPTSSSTVVTTTTTSSQQQQQLSALELLTGISTRGLNSFMPMPVQDPNTVYTPAVFPLQDFKPTLNFSIDGLGSGYGSIHDQSVQENNGRLLFPFEDLKQVSSTSTDHMEQNRGEHGDSSGYWTGMLGGGSWLASEGLT